MKINWRPIIRWGSIGIAAAAALAAILLAILQRQWNLYLQISLGLLIIGLAVFVVQDPDTIRRALTGRHAHYGSNAFILGIAFLGILVVVNYLVYKNTKQWDLTADKSNTLAKESLDVLKSLPDKVVAKAFFSSQSQSAKQSAKDLLDKYVYEGKGKFEYEFVDQNKDPVTWQNAGSPQDGSIVLFMGSSKQPVTTVSETEVTGAMVRLMNPGTHVVYFLTGHGEPSIDSSGDQTYSKLKAALVSKNYSVSSLNLLATNKIPSDASVIVVAGPMKPLSDAEVTLLGEYIKNGGSMVVMEEPLITTQFGDTPDPLAADLAKTYGIVLGNNIIVDLQANQIYQQPLLAISDQYAQHPITEKMSGMASFFPTSRSVTIDDTTGTDYTKTILIKTIDQSWAETDMASIQNNNIKFDQGVDMAGPISLAIVAEGKSNNARLVVFGDADFALDQNFTYYGNGDMIVNSIDWAAKVENIISLTPKNTVTRTIEQPTVYTRNLLFLGSIVVLPGLVLVAGVVSWVARRRRG